MMALSKRNDEPERASRARGTTAATASCSARAPASWSSSPRSTPQARGATHLRRGRRRRASPPTPTTSPSPTRPARGATRAMRMALAEAGHHARRRRPHQRARHLDAAGRRRRGRWRSGPRSATHADDVAVTGHQVDDRSPARWRRRGRVDRHDPGAARPHGSRRRSTSTTSTPRSTSTSSTASPRRCPAATSRRSTTPSASAATTWPSPSGAYEVTADQALRPSPDELPRERGPAQPASHRLRRAASTRARSS